MRRLSLCACLLAACGDDSATSIPDADPFAPDAAPLDKQLVGDGFDSPVGIATIKDDPRVFVVEQSGTVRIAEIGALQDPPFLDVHGLISCCGERGLLNLAFHPHVAQNRRFFIYYTDHNGDINIAESEIDPADPDHAVGLPPMTLLKIPHPMQGNHNGGFLAFGPDGKLYAGTGDGGGGGDPFRSAQDLMDLRGKILRLDVDIAAPYIPSDNPFAGMANARGEIWDYGVRNPWRECFDRATGDLYIGDVGQNTWEEVDVQPASSMGGINFGWSDMEGMHCYDNMPSCDPSMYQLPIYEYNHNGAGASITGGCVYRGNAIAGLQGAYFFSDEVQGYVKSLRWDGASSFTQLTSYPQFDGLTVVTFGEDKDGELLFTDYGGGRVYRIVQAP